MSLKVSPTRINLLNLRKELRVAERGYKLLKDKRDGLMKKFMSVTREARLLRQDVEKRLGSAFSSYVRASAMIPKPVMDNAFLLPNANVSLEVSTKSVMSVAIPQFTVSKEGVAFSYGFLETTGDLDVAVAAFDDVFVDVVRLAELEKTVERLAIEIEKTRRRVSALEYVRIPSLAQTIRVIGMQLEERARDAVVATMRVKAMIEAKG
ncbi:MAG: V-type ATP synthase subunit D [Candidatus Moranbacteria bacterium]|nr:V-type ATP synthase subunit D [Candidatus Moranbacteria bacterium]